MDDAQEWEGSGMARIEEVIGAGALFTHTEQYVQFAIDAADGLARVRHCLAGDKEIELARTKLAEAQMWLAKASDVIAYDKMRGGEIK